MTSEPKIVKTFCRMCSSCCGINVHIENGKIVKVEGVPENPVSKGALCAKGFAAIQFQYDQKRLEHPMKRVGERGAGEWKKISWDEALDTIASELKRVKETYGAKAVAFHRGQAPGWGSNWVCVQRFMNVFGSPNIATHCYLCHVPRVIAHALTYGGMPDHDFENAKCIILWGYNPACTAPNEARRIIDAKEGGSKLIVVDPRFTATAAKADIYVQPRPGTDGALALGMLNVIVNEGLYDIEFVQEWTIGFEALRSLISGFSAEKVEETTWVPADLVRKVARTYATTKPAVLVEGNGLDQHTNVVQTTRAIAILRAVTGNLGVVGGHVFLSPLGMADNALTLKEKLPKDTVSVSKHPLYYSAPWHAGAFVSTPELVDAIITGHPYPIKALIVQGSALGVTAPNSNRVIQALKKLDFLVVHDIYMTTAAELADIVLPATTFWEESLLLPPFGLAKKAVEPLGECWSDMKFIFELAKRMGYERYFPWKTVDQFFDEQLAPLGLTVEDLEKKPEEMLTKIAPYDYKKQGFKTLTGKVEIYSETLKQHGYDPLPTYTEPAESPVSKPGIAKTYDLVCDTGIKPGIYTHSRYRTLPWLNKIMPEPFLEMHPQKAGELGVNEGDLVLLESPRGSIKIRAKVIEAVHPKVIMVTHGWGEAYAYGAKANILTDDLPRCPISGATGNRSFLCRVRKLEG